jgi:hypothetical protein
LVLPGLTGPSLGPGSTPLDEEDAIAESKELSGGWFMAGRGIGLTWFYPIGPLVDLQWFRKGMVWP